MLTLLVLGALPLVYAKGFVSGVGRANSGSVQFSLDIYSSAVNSIVTSVHNGPNRTVSNALPVPKLYGVNVSKPLPLL